MQVSPQSSPIPVVLVV